ncbi:hypothetical protein OAE25_03115 [Verrucomicrobiales bacterium]|nr:hypothetical protein [Verrucomicrobiales bacterium]
MALQIFTDSVRGAIATYATLMGGLDGLVFSGGIGEHSALAREQICKGPEIIGCRLDPESNVENSETDRRISTASSTVETWILKAREELSIVRQLEGLI